MSQTQLADRAGVSESVISAYESGVDSTSRYADRAFDSRPSPADRSSGAHTSDAAGPGCGPPWRDESSVFGSVARGEDRSDSDVDLLVDVGPGVGLFTLARLQRKLENILQARVDLVPSEGIKPNVRADIESRKVAL